MSDIPYKVWAANEIEKLRAENAALREALEQAMQAAIDAARKE